MGLFGFYLKKSVAGKTFVITGQLESLERDDAKNLITKYGGRVVGGISGKVNFLVAGEEAGVSKMAKVGCVALYTVYRFI